MTIETLFPELFGITTTQYPPYNIVKNNDSEVTLEMAVAGLNPEDVDVEVCGNLLTISSNKKKEDRIYIHKGIASRNFRQQFKLREDMIVKSGEVKDGLLKVHLELPIPDEKKPRKLLLSH